MRFSHENHKEAPQETKKEKINGTARDRRFDFNDKGEDKVEGGDDTLKRANEPITIHTISYLAHSALSTATAQSATIGETPHHPIPFTSHPTYHGPISTFT